MFLFIQDLFPPFRCDPVRWCRWVWPDCRPCGWTDFCAGSIWVPLFGPWYAHGRCEGSVRASARWLCHGSILSYWTRRTSSHSWLQCRSLAGLQCSSSPRTPWPIDASLKRTGNTIENGNIYQLICRRFNLTIKRLLKLTYVSFFCTSIRVINSAVDFY